MKCKKLIVAKENCVFQKPDRKQFCRKKAFAKFNMLHVKQIKQFDAGYIWEGVKGRSNERMNSSSWIHLN